MFEKNQATEEVVEEAVKMVPKRVTCPRCKGTGIWVSSRTGVRAQTASEPLVDPSRPCPRCKGCKAVTIMITKAQADAEKEEAARVKKEAKAKIDADAKAKKKALDEV